mgnify:CR=1 FL=1
MITVNFTTAVSTDRRAAFERAATRWDETLNTGFAPVSIDGEQIDGVTIDAAIAPIDGPAGVLGQAGPTVLLPGSELPAKGVMEFDTADVEQLEAEGSFEDVVLHEIAHVLGFGTLWSRFGLIAASGTANPLFTGDEAAREFGALEGGGSRPVPLANTGGAGTREGHWRELVFGDELLTGFLSGANRPISRMSLGSFADMGYEVNFAAADPFELPSFRKLAEMGITEAVRICDLCRMGRTEPWVLGKKAS